MSPAARSANRPARSRAIARRACEARMLGPSAARPRSRAISSGDWYMAGKPTAAARSKMIRRLAKRRGDDRTFTPATAEAFAASIAGVISSDVAAMRSSRPMPCARAQSCNAWKCLDVSALGSARAAIWRAPGISSINGSCRAVELAAEKADPGRHIATGMGHRPHEPFGDHIIDVAEDRYRRRRPLRGANGRSPASLNNIDRGVNQLDCSLGELLGAQSEAARIDRQVLPL